jgi:hypothetical protein
VDSPKLAVSELNYHPTAPTPIESAALGAVGQDEFEFIEIRNVGMSAASLSGIRLADGVEFDFTTAKVKRLDPGQFVLVVKNELAFVQRYGVGLPIAGSYLGSLNDDGEDVDLVDGLGQVIFTVKFADSDPWPQRADGLGATLELIDPLNTAAAQQSKYYSWRGSQRFGGTPGSDSVAPLGIVINEVLAHTDPPLTLPDSIEIHNTTAMAIDIGGWYLSDAASNLRKYRIPDGTLVGPGGYVVFDESDFNPHPLNPGPNDFALNGAQGDDVWLTAFAANGSIIALVDDVHFPASANGESLARFPNGQGRLMPAQQNTFGSSNGAPRVGPLVISEFNYSPAAPSPAALAIDAALSSSDLEFVEIHNPTASPVVLTNWRLRGGADFDFAAGTTLAAGETLLIVPFNPAKPANAQRLQAFHTHYGLDSGVRIVGGYDGQLNNADEAIRLQRPDQPPLDDPDFYPHLLEDEVLYDDLAPWPTGADGTGMSLHRREVDQPGNDPSSWHAHSATPGIVDFAGRVIGDFDGNRLVDQLDIDLLCQQIQRGPSPAFDLTGDQTVDLADMSYLIKSVLRSSFGDANLDGVFNSTDLIEVFGSGKYEDASPGNATWATGDWNCDGVFDSSDLIQAFADGGYSTDATPDQFGGWI